MTSVTSGSDSLFFHRKEEIVDHLLEKVLANKNRYVGTEWEMFLVKPEFFSNPDKKSFTREEGQRAFEEFNRVFALMGYKTTSIHEKTNEGQKITGLNVDGLGVITPEIGHQFEFASLVSKSCDEVREKNEEAYRAISEVAKRLNFIPVFKGHVPGFAERTESPYRSRSKQWGIYYDKLSGADSASIRQVLDSTASTQVTIDAGAEKFHEFYQALLLVEPAFTLHYMNSQRPHISVKTYSDYIPSQVEPITGIWGTRNPREALEAFVDRLIKVDVPFLPDSASPGLYKAEPFIGNRSATVEDLMRQGRLNEKALNNVGGFILTRPGFRNFSQALLELRGVDSQPTPERVTEVAQRVTALLYDDAVRERLLKDYAHLSQPDIKKLHDTAAMVDKSVALGQEVANVNVGAFVEDILTRSEVAIPYIALRSVKTGITPKKLII